MHLVLRLGLLSALLLALTSGVVGCAHAPPQQQRDARRLRALERSFHEFVSVQVSAADDIEPAVARLESLRFEYLDALTISVEEGDRLLALLRLAEAHLDLSARIRRVAYPIGIVDGDRSAFDASLSARALPLEATGLSLLGQVVQRGTDVGVDGRFVKRARLYLRLHTESRLTPGDLDILRTELVAVTWRAPRTLLDTGRIGQRAARR